MTVRRMLTEPKTALADVGLETSFARFATGVITFSKENLGIVLTFWSAGLRIHSRNLRWL